MDSATSARPLCPLYLRCDRIQALTAWAGIVLNAALVLWLGVWLTMHYMADAPSAPLLLLLRRTSSPSMLAQRAWQDRRRPNEGELASAPARDRRAALFVVAVNAHALPDAVLVIRIAAHEGVGHGAISGVDDENAADRGLAVVGKERAGGHHIDAVLFGAVEMNPMRTVMLGAGRQNVFLVEGVDDEQHATIIALPRAAREGDY